MFATLVGLLEITHIRAGNEEHAKANHSFGLTTLRNRHVHISGTAVRFHFRGKSGKQCLRVGPGACWREGSRPRGSYKLTGWLYLLP